MSRGNFNAIFRIPFKEGQREKKQITTLFSKAELQWVRTNMEVSFHMQCLRFVLIGRGAILKKIPADLLP